MDILVGLVVILNIFALAVCIFFLFRKNQKPRINRQKQRIRIIQAKSSQQTKKSLPHRLEKKLLSRLGGEQATAQRLVASIRLKYPERDEVWCWEKAISDLERDRA